MSSYLCGLEHSNKDFSEADSYGKNTFTTAFPVALSCYIDKKGLPQNYILACLSSTGKPGITQALRPLHELIGIDPALAYFGFEDSFEGYNSYAVNQANRSDIVVKNYQTGDEVSALEVKLVAVPTSGTASKPRGEQLCELVVRPPSIEQLCFSVAASFGQARRQEIGDIIVNALEDPIDYDWSNERFMLGRRQAVLDAAHEIIRRGIDSQQAFALMGEWRTLGQEPELDDDCFDCFYWSNLAFLQLFTRVMESAIERNTQSIGRPDRALIWFVKSMFDYSAQGRVTFERTHSLITYGGQTDKAGSFTNNNIRPFVVSDNFVCPRIKKDERQEIISDQGAAMLKPERRLDAVLISEGMKELLRKFG